jgi:hypothetical protein
MISFPKKSITKTCCGLIFGIYFLASSEYCNGSATGIPRLTILFDDWLRTKSTKHAVTGFADNPHVKLSPIKRSVFFEVSIEDHSGVLNPSRINVDMHSVEVPFVSDYKSVRVGIKMMVFDEAINRFEVGPVGGEIAGLVAKKSE